MANRPMTMTDLSEHLRRRQEDKVRWKHVWEFFEEYRWEPPETKPLQSVGVPTARGRGHLLLPGRGVRLSDLIY